jgi:hypothetical protein
MPMVVKYIPRAATKKTASKMSDIFLPLID